MWLLSLLAQRAGSIGPLSLPKQAILAWWHPTRQLGGEIRHFLSPLHMLGWWGKGALRQAPICVPWRRAAQLEAEGVREGAMALGTFLIVGLSSSKAAPAPSELEPSGEEPPCLDILRAFALALPSPRMIVPQVARHFLPGSFVSALVATLSERWSLTTCWLERDLYHGVPDYFITVPTGM